jgi:VWFA-related protein
MFVSARAGLLFLLPILCTSAVYAQQSGPLAQAAQSRIYLDVVVTAKSGPPVQGLQQQDFTVLDNKAPQTIATFQALGGSQAPIEVVLVVDAVNTEYRVVSFERDQVDKYLGANAGRLAFPTSLVFVTDTGTEMLPTFTKDGNDLKASLEQHTVALRSIRRSTGYYGAAERYELSLKALEMVAEHEAARPGRKIILWMSPGWPLLSGPGIELSLKQEERIFEDIVNMSDRLRAARITLYSIDPLGVEEAAGRTFYYQEFVKGVKEPRQALPGDLGLEVLATQSGGLALNSTNDVTALLQKCMADLDAYYEISFDPPLSDKRNEYHHLEVRLANHKLAARTRQGYYSQPSPHN